MVSQEEYNKRNIEKILANPGINKANREILKKYDTHAKFQRLTIGTRSQRLITLQQLALFVKKDFKAMTKKDIEDYFSSLGELQPKTWSTKGAFIKSFFKWLHNSDHYPPNVKWINTTVQNRNRKLPSDLLTKAEVMAMVEAADNLLDRAFIMVLYESACRIGEMLNLKIKDVSIDQYGSAIVVKGKTGMRRIRLIESSPDLVLWMKNHPQKQDRDGPLFIYLANKNQHEVRGEGLDHHSAKRIIDKLVKRAKINKRVHPHLFRHSRLTELAKDFSESELKIIAGWTGSSTMAGVYVHLSGGDIERKILEKNGLLNNVDDLEKETKNNESLNPQECPRCKEINPNNAKFCYSCSMVLDIKAAVGIENKEHDEPQANNVLQELINHIIKKHPELVLEFLKENNTDATNILASGLNLTTPILQAAAQGLTAEL